jgi:hypothetical protein
MADLSVAHGRDLRDTLLLRHAHSPTDDIFLRDSQERSRINFSSPQQTSPPLFWTEQAEFKTAAETFEGRLAHQRATSPAREDQFLLRLQAAEAQYAAPPEKAESRPPSFVQGPHDMRPNNSRLKGGYDSKSCQRETPVDDRPELW